MKALRFATAGRNTRLAACAALLLLLPASYAPASIIDTFTAAENGDPDSVSVISAVGSSTLNFVITPGVTDPIGSRRQLGVIQNSPSQTAAFTIDGSSGVAAITSSASATSSWSIVYGVGLPGGLHFDATAGGAFAFRMTFDSVSPSLEYVIGAYGYTSTGTSYGGFYKPVTAGNIDVPFSTFSASSGPINFADLNQIDIRIRDAGLTHGGNATLTQFEIVPEPTSGALLGLTAAGAFVLRRRRPTN